MEQLKFKCLQCGACCKNISGKLTSSRGLPLFEWEVNKIKILAKRYKLNIKIKPIDIVLDKKSNSYFCTGYLLANEPCAFLKNNKCLIHKNRPIICRAFPIAKNPLFLNNIPNLSCFSKCPKFNFNNFLSNSLNLKEGKSYEISKKEIIKKYKKVFDKETMAASFARDNIFRDFNNLMYNLSKDNLIDLKVIKKEKKIIPIPFLQFLVKREFISKKDKIKIIKGYLK